MTGTAKMQGTLVSHCVTVYKEKTADTCFTLCDSVQGKDRVTCFTLCDSVHRKDSGRLFHTV